MSTHRLDQLCDSLKATYSITRDPSLPTVRIALALATGDTVSGNGATTIDAIDNLVEKCKMFDVLPKESTL